MAIRPRQMVLIPFRKVDSGESFEYLLSVGKNKEPWGWVQEFEWSDKTNEDMATDLAVEHLGLAKHSVVVDLDAKSSLPRCTFFTQGEDWPEEVFIVPVVCFAIFTANQSVVLSESYSEMKWVSYD